MSKMRLMLSCILLSLFLQTYFVSAKLPDWVTPDMIAMVASDKARCMAEHGTTQDLIDMVNDGNIPNDPKITCYMYCLFESFSVIDDDGVLEAEMLAGLFPENVQALATSILGPCASQPGADNCEKVYNIAKCAHSKDPSNWPFCVRYTALEKCTFKADVA